MPFTKTKCPKCNKDAESAEHFELNGVTVHVLKCGHLLSAEHLEASDASSLVSLDGKRPFKFQVDGVKFVENSGGRALIADEMGLGKTIQALATIALHPKEMLPAVYFVKSALKIQWAHEIMRWVSKSDSEEDLAFAQVIETSRDKMLPGVKHYLFSMDILRRFKNGSLNEEFKKRGIKTIIIDECQAIKNPESQRTHEVRSLCKDIPNVIALSGTPIKNNASEYFSILNILKPELFPKYSQFLYRDCDSYYNGYGYKVGGLRHPEEFARKTKSFIIRRERKDVMPDLPKVQRSFHFDSLGEEVEDAYKETFVKFREDYYSGNGNASRFAEEGNILAYLSRMRHLTGLSKINPCVEFVEEFLQETDRKITIFLHHKDVGQILARKIDKICEEMKKEGAAIDPPEILTAELSSEQRDEVVQSFMNEPKSRILIASTLASGEGLNLQKCSDCILLERQWNPANEEQAEARFIRIGQEASSVMATYFVAVGTVDEFFSKIVEEKREIVSKTLGNEETPKWDQSSLIRELAEVLASTGGRQWNI